MDNQTLTTNDPFKMTDAYNEIYALYESILDSDQGPVENLASILMMDNIPSIATYGAWDIFNLRGRQRGSSNFYASSNFFEDNSERRVRETMIKSLNQYIRRLEPIRNGYNKIATLYSYLIAQGLYGLLSELYIPDYMKEIVDNLVDEVNNKLDSLIDEVKEYFSKKNNEYLSRIINSLGRLLLAQRSDQVLRTLQKFDDTLDSTDLEFLQEKRSEYLRYQDSPQLQIAKKAFNLSDGSYYRNLDVIVSDLTNLLDEDSYNLLTDLFLRN